MFGEQQAIIPNFTSYSTPNPNPLPPHTDASQYSYSLGFDGLQDRSAFELHRAAASQSGMNSQTTVSTTKEHAGVTMSETANNVLVTTKQPENIQIFQCEVCNITCNTKDVLEQHKQGKKHLKCLQKLADSSVNAPKMVQTPVASENSVGELENKKHRLLQNGATADRLIYCDICNVVCNNQEVFQNHVAGRKHSAKAIIQLASTNGIFAATSDSTVASQKKPDTFQCGLCKITCTSNELLNMHVAGKKHLKKLKESGQIPNLPLIPVASQDTPPAKPVVNPESNEAKTINSNESKPLCCELCGISCDTNEVFKSHLSGKKHQKNLEKSEKLMGPILAPIATSKVIGLLQEEGKIVNSDGSKRKKKRAGSDEDVETKKQKVLQSGAALDAVQTCTLCNVVCNSPKVFFAHLAGQKHIAMAVKQAETQATGQAS